MVKPFVVCASDGQIVDIYGLYPANQNDAHILSHILQDPNGIRSILKKNDIFLLDRGFRDCIQALNTVYNLNPKMPSFLSSKNKQLSTFEANQSRLVTKCRWVVEVTNAFLKKIVQSVEKCSE